MFQSNNNLFEIFKLKKKIIDKIKKFLFSRKNRQFRYEEKDAVGNVKGHFGYYDTNGKLQLFNYHADETGFQAVQVD